VHGVVAEVQEPEGLHPSRVVAAHALLTQQILREKEIHPGCMLTSRKTHVMFGDHVSGEDQVLVRAVGQLDWIQWLHNCPTMLAAAREVETSPLK
jgi:hypothetical protein